MGAGLLAAILLPAAANAATFVVTSTLDVMDATPGNGVCATDTTSPAGGRCTLRAAVQEANTAPGGPHTIVLPAGTYTLTITGPGEDAAATGDLDITASMTISGSGAATTIIDGGNIDRVLHVMAGTIVTISGVTIRGGNQANIPSTNQGTGGGIYNTGTLTLNDSVVSGNRASGVGGIFNTGTLTLNNSSVSGNEGGRGGGIYNGGLLTLNNSTVSGNNAGGEGGIYNGAGTVILNNSTVSGNTAIGWTGGIRNDCPGGGTDNDHWIATLILNNSTVSGNSAANFGGGIVNSSSQNRGCSGAVITLNNSTVSGNSARIGGGIAQYWDNTPRYPATITLKNSIVAGNTASSAPDNCYGTMTSLGHNIAGDASCALAGIGDRNGIDPLLGPLANNGGPTQTHAPLPGSPAIDAVPLADCTNASGAPLATDQRGVARPQGAACDIGSVDVKPSVWVLVIGFAGGHGDSIATVPRLFATQVECGAAGQAWLAKAETLPSFDPWDSKWPAKFLCFQTPNN